MGDLEIIVRYKWLMHEAWALHKQAEKVQLIGAPQGVAGQALTGMPHGTNDPVAASIQAYDGYCQRLRAKAAELLSICDRFEAVIEKIGDDRQRVICRMYYGLDMTEEKIAEKLHIDQSTVNRDREKATSNFA